MRNLLLFLLLYSFSLPAEVNRSLRRSDIAPQLKSAAPVLQQAIALIYQTGVGQQQKADIEELRRQGKIKLRPLRKGHYGESGEGCVIKNKHYFYEGLFVLLKQDLKAPELASSLVHEVNHYQMIRQAIAGQNETMTIAYLEVNAYAKQYEFIQALENLKLADSANLFGEDGPRALDIMRSAFFAKTFSDPNAYERTLKKLVAFGYPARELKRRLLVRSAQDCKGEVK